MSTYVGRIYMRSARDPRCHWIGWAFPQPRGFGSGRIYTFNDETTSPGSCGDRCFDAGNNRYTLERVHEFNDGTNWGTLRLPGEDPCPDPGSTTLIRVGNLVAGWDACVKWYTDSQGYGQAFLLPGTWQSASWSAFASLHSSFVRVEMQLGIFFDWKLGDGDAFEVWERVTVRFAHNRTQVIISLNDPGWDYYVTADKTTRYPLAAGALDGSGYNWPDHDWAAGRAAAAAASNIDFFVNRSGHSTFTSNVPLTESEWAVRPADIPMASCSNVLGPEFGTATVVPLSEAWRGMAFWQGTGASDNFGALLDQYNYTAG